MEDINIADKKTTNLSVYEHIRKMYIESISHDTFNVNDFKKLFSRSVEERLRRYKDFLEKVKNENNSELFESYNELDEELYYFASIFDKLCIVGLYMDFEQCLKNI